MIAPLRQKPALLLVEDSEDDAFFFHRALEKTGIDCSVSHVADGSAAVEFLSNAFRSNSLPEIVFLDLKMPVLNGFDVLEWLRRQTFSSLIPVVVLSGSDNEVDKDDSRRLGAQDYIVKPVTAEDFQRLFSQIASDDRKLAPKPGGGLA